MTLTKDYNPSHIEKTIQAAWEEKKYFRVKENLNIEKFYCLPMLPYPSGNLHMGHVRNYTISDMYARYQRMKGKNVLQAIGWDAFGLPAENAAIDKNIAPAKWIQKNIRQMRQELKRLGFAYDWKREFTTSDPSYYRWEQWLFIQLYKRGLAYRKKAVVNWDPIDNTILANEQVIDGRGWRSGALVERREGFQWFLKITDYADELLDQLETLKEWPEEVRTMQKNWIGRSEGARIDFSLANGKDDTTLSVFTTRLDTLIGVTFLAISPDHPLIESCTQDNPAIAEFRQRCQNIKVSEAEVATMEKSGIDTGLRATHPITGDQLPVWIANFVVMQYGSGAVMCVPAHDQRDFEFSRKYQLPLKQVIMPKDGTDWDFSENAFTEKGTLINSGTFNSQSSHEAAQTILKALVELKKGEALTQYRLRDWSISRQRYWGAPIPIIYCNTCGTVPVPEDDLPVILPTNLTPSAEGGSPLASDENFLNTACPKCGEAARREADTFDTFMDSSWYYARYTCNTQNTVILDDRAKYWTPVDLYVGGIEHATLHLLYARFIHKVLRDQGLLNSNEPFTRLLTQGMVLKDSAKMSKSRGNTVPPGELIEKYGADTLRLFIIFAAPANQSMEWSDHGVEGAYRFLKRLWDFGFKLDGLIQERKSSKASPESENWSSAPSDSLEKRKEVHTILRQANLDIERTQLNTVVSAAMKLLNLLGDIKQCNPFEYKLTYETYSILLRLLWPITPHITQALWEGLGYGPNILQARWPEVDPKALKTSTVNMVVQINGKLRDHIQLPIDSMEDTIQQTALSSPKIKKHIGDKSYKKIIIVSNKLINIVV